MHECVLTIMYTQYYSYSKKEKKEIMKDNSGLNIIFSDIIILHFVSNFFALLNCIKILETNKKRQVNVHNDP